MPTLTIVKRIFLMGPPGSFRQENSNFIADQFGWKCISTGELLKNEVKKKSEIGKKVQESFQAFQYGMYFA
jgi:adenylate kinase family enzyme